MNKADAVLIRIVLTFSKFNINRSKETAKRPILHYGGQAHHRYCHGGNEARGTRHREKFSPVNHHAILFEIM